MKICMYANDVRCFDSLTSDPCATLLPSVFVHCTANTWCTEHLTGSAFYSVSVLAVFCVYFSVRSLDGRNS